MRQDQTWGNRLFDIINHSILFIVAIVCVLPFVYVLAVSFASPAEVAKGGLILWPKEWSLVSYQYIFSSDTLPRSLLVSIYITVVGTLINLAFTSLMAYPLSKPHLRGRNPILLGVLITMLFSGDDTNVLRRERVESDQYAVVLDDTKCHQCV